MCGTARSGVSQGIRCQPTVRADDGFLAPPGAMIGTFTRGTSKEMFIAKLAAAQSGCGAGQLSSLEVFGKKNIHTARVASATLPVHHRIGGWPPRYIYTHTHTCYIRFSASFAETEISFQENQEC